MSPEASSEGQSLPPGTLLHEYEVREELGAGGFGITYLAWDTQLKREVVIMKRRRAYPEAIVSAFDATISSGVESGITST